MPMLTSLYEWMASAAAKIKLWDAKSKLNPGKTRGRKRFKLNLFQELTMTLVRIRRGYDSHHIGYLFGISQSHVCRIFTAWVNFLAVIMKPLLIWPSRDLDIDIGGKDDKLFEKSESGLVAGLGSRMLL